jgi:hypothetical protein
VTPLEYFWLSYGLAFLLNGVIERLLNAPFETKARPGDIRLK